MISHLKFNELENRVDLLVNRVLELEQQVRTLTESQGGDIPPGMAPVATLAAEFGISTKKAEELAKNTGVMLVRMKAGGFIARKVLLVVTFTPPAFRERQPSRSPISAQGIALVISS